MIFLNSAAYGENVDDERAIGASYAYLFLLTLSPDFAAAHYTFTDEPGQDLNISTSRFPYHIDLMKDSESSLQFEIVAAYQQMEEIFQVTGLPGESIDAKWNTYGLGLLYEHNISKQLRFTPGLRIGVATMKNNAIYNGITISQ